MQSRHTSFAICNQPVDLCPFLTVAHDLNAVFSGDKVVWYCHHFKNFPQFVVIHTVKGHSQWSRTRYFSGIPLLSPWSDKYWKLVSGSSASVKCSLYNWKFSVQILMKPSLKDFEHNCISMQNECNSWNILWNCLFGIGKKTDIFQFCGHCWVFQICWHIEFHTFTASSFRIWNISAAIPSSSLALFIVMLPKAYSTSHSRMSVSRWVITLSWLSGLLRPFLYSFSVYFCRLFLISSVSFLCMKCSLVSPIFLKWSVVFPTASFISVSLHYTFKKSFFCLLALF